MFISVRVGVSVVLYISFMRWTPITHIGYAWGGFCYCCERFLAMVSEYEHVHESQTCSVYSSIPYLPLICTDASKAKTFSISTLIGTHSRMWYLYIYHPCRSSMFQQGTTIFHAPNLFPFRLSVIKLQLLHLGRSFHPHLLIHLYLQPRTVWMIRLQSSNFHLFEPTIFYYLLYRSSSWFSWFPFTSLALIAFIHVLGGSY